jgi:hypothetical protein
MAFERRSALLDSSALSSQNFLKKKKSSRCFFNGTDGHPEGGADWGETDSGGSLREVEEFPHHRSPREGRSSNGRHPKAIEIESAVFYYGNPKIHRAIVFFRKSFPPSA